MRPEERPERKRGRQPLEKKPDAIELPQKVRKTSRVAELERQLNELKANMSTAGGAPAQELVERMQAQDEKIEDLSATLQVLRFKAVMSR